MLKNQKFLSKTTSELEHKYSGESFWYALATVRQGIPDQSELNDNSYYWNGFIKSKANASILKKIDNDWLENNPLPDLSETELNLILESLKARGFDVSQLPELPEDGNFIDFVGLEFLAEVNLSGFCFPVETRFSFSIFSDLTTIEQAYFAQLACFKECRFKQTATFNRSIFQDSTFFEKTQFDEGCSFEEIHSYWPWFYLCEFRNGVTFSRSTFVSSASFQDAQILGDGNFRRVEFLGRAYFSGTKFGRGPLQNSISGGARGEIDFQYSNFTMETSFVGAIFNSIPAFFEAHLNENTRWSQTIWPVVDEDDRLEDRIRRYHRLAKLMGEAGLFEEEHRFFRLSMRARRDIEGSVSSLFHWLYEHLADYGMGLSKALFYWILNVVVGGIMIFGAVYRDDFGDGTETPILSVNSAVQFVKSMAISFSNSHSFLGLSKSYLAESISGAEEQSSYIGSQWLHVIGVVQSFAGTILLFLLVLTLRNKFKIR